MTTILSTPLEESLLRAAEDNPLNDIYKMVLADYYEDAGDERARAWRWVVEKGRNPVARAGHLVVWWRSTLKPPSREWEYSCLLPEELVTHLRKIAKTAPKEQGSGSSWGVCYAKHHHSPWRKAMTNLVRAWLSSSPQEKISYAEWTPPQHPTKE